jgi:hypothetical protein
VNALHNALAAIDAQPGDDDRTELAKAKARAQITGYHQRYADAGYTPTAIEQEFHLPIINPGTGHPSKNFQQAGKIDAEVIAPSGEHHNLDHKTTSMDIADPAAVYWRQLAVESQVSMYALACWQQCRKVDGSVWDVIRKPTIRPAKLTKAEIKAIGDSSEYHGYPITVEDWEYVQVVGRENTHLYECRLTRDCLDRPLHYYQRRTVPRLDSEMLAWAEELWTVAKDIRETQIRANLCEKPETAWFRNSGACMNYGTPCEYLGLCSGSETPDNGMWDTRTRPHEELAVTSDETRWNVLTHSSIRCYATCRRKAYYRYELRLKRIDEEEKEATYYGSLIHVGLNAWWQTFLEDK